MSIQINSDYIRTWCTEHFQVFRIQSGGEEFVTNSFLVEDSKKHLSINLSTGLWQDFKAGEKGNFIRLFALRNGVSYQVAQKFLLTRTLYSFHWVEDPSTARKITPGSINLGNLLAITADFPNKYPGNAPGLVAWDYLYTRKLLSTDDYISYFYISDLPELENRIVIPYFEGSTPYFYIARSLDPKVIPKYTYPKKEESPCGAHEILFPFNDFGDELIITEGQICAITLQMLGLNATATGTNRISPDQAEILKDYRGKIILAFDNDKAGQDGQIKARNTLINFGVQNIYVCNPPKKCKDWNDALIQNVDIVDYFTKNTEKFDWFLAMQLKL